MEQSSCVNPSVDPCDDCGCKSKALEGIASDSPGPAAQLEAMHLTDGTNGVMLTDAYVSSREPVLTSFHAQFSEPEQLDMVVRMLGMMGHAQHSVINAFLGPLLQRDFVSLLPARGLSTLADTILSYVDASSLCQVERVCRSWRQRVADGQLWRKLIERNVRTDNIWQGLSERRGWRKYLFRSREQMVPLVVDAWTYAQKFYENRDEEGTFVLVDAEAMTDTALLHLFYRKLYPEIIHDIETIEDNWKMGRHALHRINCHSENSKGVYCLQYDGEKIVSGLRDNTIKVWNVNTMQSTMVLTGHTGSVLCLQYDDRAIISGSSDSTVRVWHVRTGELINTLVHHCEAVLHLRFHDGMMVTCSKDRSIAVWDMASPSDITLRRVLVGHRAAVNVVDFDSRYIVSASGDRTIKVWSADSCEFLRTLSGHRRGIACLQYRENLVVSGSSDNTIRLWDIESGQCLRTLEGHEELVRCIRFDNKHIVSGAYDGKIKVWDLAAALDARTPLSQVCLVTLNEHTGRVFRLQFDEFQIVSSSHDDTILIWDFINYNTDNRTRLPLVFSASPPLDNSVVDDGHDADVVINDEGNPPNNEQAVDADAGLDDAAEGEEEAAESADDMDEQQMVIDDQ